MLFYIKSNKVLYETFAETTKYILTCHTTTKTQLPITRPFQPSMELRRFCFMNTRCDLQGTAMYIYLITYRYIYYINSLHTQTNPVLDGLAYSHAIKNILLNGPRSTICYQMPFLVNGSYSLKHPCDFDV